MQTPTYKPSRRMHLVQTPVIPVIGKLIRETPGTISLGQGVVYYGPPQSAMDRITGLGKSLEHHKYTPVEGIPELQAALGNKLRLENHIDIGNGNRIIVTAGANMGFLNAILAITDPGDEIILPSPYYFNHEMAVSMLNCTPVPIPTDNLYQPCLERIEAVISKRTRAIVTVSPNNPSGAVYPETVLREINCLCMKYGIYHISDEAYEYFTYNGACHFSPGSGESSAMHTISLYSLSKAYGLASWRIGYMVIPEHLAMAVMKAQDTNLICPALVSQHAALGALEAGPAYCHQKFDVIREVRKIMLTELKKISSFCTIPAADGAFYFLLEIDTDIDSMELARRLIREHQVAVIPGVTFGMKESCRLRVAYGALDRQTALEGVQRLTNGLSAIVR